jgi:hypothetical protein
MKIHKFVIYNKDLENNYTVGVLTYCDRKNDIDGFIQVKLTNNKRLKYDIELNKHGNRRINNIIEEKFKTRILGKSNFGNCK